MGTVIPRKRKDGTTAFNAQIVIKRKGVTVLREAKTFERRPAAMAWIAKREEELSRPGALEASMADDPPLSEVIDQYIRESRKAIGRTKAQVLTAIKQQEIADMKCSKVTSADIVGLAQALSTGRKPQTVQNYLSHLGSVVAIARPAWGYPLDPMVMKDVFAVTNKLGITGKSVERERRPTIDELKLILSHYADREKRRPSMNPMTKIVMFALFSTRRQEEITRIAWADLDEEGSRVMVRDMKNPGEKIGNNVWCDIPPEAMEIVTSMPRTEGVIFPYTADAISASFTRVTAFLGIENLHFHDLRHEGVSRLFEMGWSIPKVASVSGHRSWTSLKRYTHVRQTGDKYASWAWRDLLLLDRVKR